MDHDDKPMTTKELTAAVSLLLEREETRIEQERRKQRRRVRRRREETREGIARLAQSIEVIKWCLVGIATYMGISLIILVLVVWQLGNEAQRIKGEVEEIKVEAKAIVEKIETEADQIRDKIQNPLRSIGGALGGQLDTRLQGIIGNGNE